VILVKNYREAATKIIIAAGLLITLFTSMDSMEGGPSLGTLINVTPGLAIVGLGLLSKKFPREIGGIILVITAILVLIIFSKGLTIYQVATALIVAVPLVTAAAFLFTRDKSEPGIEPKEPT
jgi:hypothetical protein